MSFAHTHPLVPLGESPRTQKIEFCIPNLKLMKLVFLLKCRVFLSALIE